MSVEVFISDLTPEAQTRVLDALGIATAEEGNYDVFPLFTVEEQDW